MIEQVFTDRGLVTGPSCMTGLIRQLVIMIVTEWVMTGCHTGVTLGSHLCHNPDWVMIKDDQSPDWAISRRWFSMLSMSGIILWPD